MSDTDRQEAFNILDQAISHLATLVGGDTPRLTERLTDHERHAIRDALALLLPLPDPATGEEGMERVLMGPDVLAVPGMNHVGNLFEPWCQIKCDRCGVVIHRTQDDGLCLNCGRTL